MEKYYLAALHEAMGYASQHLRLLLQLYGSAEECFSAPVEEVITRGKLPPALANHYRTHYHSSAPLRLQEFCAQQHIQLLANYEEEYPASLRTLTIPPAVLYVKGHLPKQELNIGIVGSRKATPSGIRTAHSFASYLAERQVTIVSGGAYGIDSAAHQGALDAQGATIAVLGTGIDVVYPRSNRKCFEAICERGALVTEFSPGEPPIARHFPMRNRIIVGLSQGICVVEAAQKSGAKITADLALSANKDVFCLPGSIYTPTCEGTNNLIKEGAYLVTTPEDILFTYEMAESAKAPTTSSKQLKLFENVSAEEKQLLDLLQSHETMLAEEFIQSTSFSPAQLSAMLLNLQLDGIIKENTNKSYSLL